eukprot:TRINITY_DN5834_c0_g1_i3.p1 TRINITY_DN5834_c0_g1~~TRINITY_DN5834_c0_g1_i3.p1  ORF type:complete len:661 (+),score=163.65 TRINITY_DN5834_c0_g1_i3:142-2124(+)
MSRVNPLLEEERNRASFNVRDMVYLLDGGRAEAERKEKLRKLIDDDPEIRDITDEYFMSRLESHTNAYRKGLHVIKKSKELGLTEQEVNEIYHEINLDPPFAVHLSMFIPTLRTQADEEQTKEWLPKALDYKIIGTYAQTELGHGTFIRGCETTATYDSKTQEFVVHSPTLTSTKFWPGGLGKTSNHVVLMAQLILENGQNKGLHSFIVPIRSMVDHEPLPGVTVGDIGPKFGYGTIDNGFLRFDHVRIPRRNMLMRFAKVSPEGTYSKPPHDKIAYGTMLYVRVGIVFMCFRAIAQAVTVATRYSAIRRQGFVLSQKLEDKVIDYKSQQMRLFPMIATAYAFHYTGVWMRRMYTVLQDAINNDNFKLLPEVHATASGLKAFTTWITSDSIEECRKMCGGHGYSNFSGLPQLFVEIVPSCTYEGDNYVLIQQTARYILKALKGVMGGKVPVGSLAYLADISRNSDKCNVRTKEEFLDPQIQLNAYKHRAIRLALETGKNMEKEMNSGKSYENSWNSCMPDFLRLVRAHCFFVMVQNFIDGVNQTADPNLRNIIKKLCDLFTLFYLEKDLVDYLEDGFMNSNQAGLVRDSVKFLLDQIRPEAVALVDSFNISDRKLNSALGRYDGNAYEAMFSLAQRSEFNKKNVLDSYHQYLKPLFHSKM